MSKLTQTINFNIPLDVFSSFFRLSTKSIRFLPKLFGGFNLNDAESDTMPCTSKNSIQLL